MNILVLGTDIVEQKLINLALKSKHLDHIYTASNTPLENIPNIEFTDYADLVQKSKALQVDIVLVANRNYVLDGIVEIFRKNMLNIIAVNPKWMNLETSRLAAKQLMQYYSINTPVALKAPLAFPVVIKTDNPDTNKIAYSMQELIHIRESLSEKKVFLEEFLSGEILNLVSLWDGKNLLTFPPKNPLTEVQKDRLELYKTKLNFMLSDEKVDFIGFFISKLIWSKNDWYVLEYIMHLNEDFEPETITQDFLYILNSAIYQKLGEIQIF